MDMTYEFEMDPITMESNKGVPDRNADNVFPVVEFCYVPMGDTDRQYLIENHDDEDDSHKDCTQWLVLRMVSSWSGGTPEYEVCMWPLADDYSTPSDTPYMQGYPDDADGSEYYKQVVEACRLDQGHTEM